MVCEVRLGSPGPPPLRNVYALVLTKSKPSVMCKSHLYMVEDWSVEKVSASTAIERGSVGFESTDKVQRVTKAASKAKRNKQTRVIVMYLSLDAEGVDNV